MAQQTINRLGDLDKFERIEANFTELYAADVVHDAAVAALQQTDGVATVAAGTAAIVVAHGLVGTPTKIQATPREDIDIASHWWIDTIGATNFTINTNANVTADADFGWQAQL